MNLGTSKFTTNWKEIVTPLQPKPNIVYIVLKVLYVLEVRGPNSESPLNPISQDLQENLTVEIQILIASSIPEDSSEVIEVFITLY